MNKNELVQYFVDTYNYYKKDLKTIKNIQSCAEDSGYLLIKNGVDDYTLMEQGTIKDFTKPLIIHREIPALAATETYNGVPVGLLASLEYYCSGLDQRLWCYLANKQNGDTIRFNELRSLYDTDLKIAIGFDRLCCFGHLRETAENIEFYFYPLPVRYKLPRELENGIIRLTPLKFCS